MTNDMDLDQIKEIAIAVYEIVESGDQDDAIRMRMWLAGKGFEAGKHVGDPPDSFDEIRSLEWALGQFMTLVDKHSWFAMNSVLNKIYELAQ